MYRDISLKTPETAVRKVPFGGCSFHIMTSVLVLLFFPSLLPFMDLLRAGRGGAAGGWGRQGQYSTAVGNFQSAPAAEETLTATIEETWATTYSLVFLQHPPI